MSKSSGLKPGQTAPRSGQYQRPVIRVTFEAVANVVGDGLEGLWTAYGKRREGTEYMESGRLRNGSSATTKPAAARRLSRALDIEYPGGWELDPTSDADACGPGG